MVAPRLARVLHVYRRVLRTRAKVVEWQRVLGPVPRMLSRQEFLNLEWRLARAALRCAIARAP